MKNLKYWRQEVGLTQIDLAIATGISRGRIQLIEGGLSSLTDLEVEKICRILQRLPSDLGIVDVRNETTK